MTLARPLRRILCATDFSPSAEAALEWSSAVAKIEKAELHLAHVFQVPELVTPAGTMASLEAVSPAIERESAARMAELGKGRSLAGSHVRKGSADVELVALAGELGADLVVVGTHGRTGLSHVLLGSIAERVIRTSPVPVATIPGTHRTRPDSPIRKVLVPCDLAGGAERAVAEALALAQRFEARIDLLHVLDLPPYALADAVRAEIEAAARRDLAALAARHATSGSPIETDVRVGLAGDTIAAVAAELEADLVVLPTHARRGMARFFFGSVAERVARTAHRPVLTIRGFEAMAAR